MDIAFIHAKNVLWSLSFGTATQAAHVSLGKEKSSLCNGPVPCPMSMPFVQEDVCCGCLGKFYAESSVKGEEGKKRRESLFPFTFFKYKGKQKGGVVFFFKVFS